MTDCVIVGGGAIGMMTARELRRRGLSVTLLERHRCGGEASWAGGGILAPLYPWRFSDAVNALARQSLSAYPALFRDLHAQTGIDPEHEATGLLVLDAPARIEVESWARRCGYRCEFIGSEQIRELEPQLSVLPEQATWMPELGHVRNPRLVRALRAAVEMDGVIVRENEPVTGLLTQRGHVTGVRTAKGEIRADRVLLASGAWSGLPIGALPEPPKVRPVRGQMILIKAEPGIVNRVVLHQDHYLIPRRDGRVLVGSTLEETGFNKETTLSAREMLCRYAIDCVPALGRYKIEHHWAGLRPGTAEGVPYICQHPQLNGLFINAGHFRNGIVTGLASAQLCAQLICDESPKLPIQAYAFAR
jgi:glycine oxidase